MSRNAYLLLFLTMLFWSGNAIAGKLAVGHISPMLLTVLRWTMSFILIYAIGSSQLRRDWAQVKAHLLLLFCLGTAGFALFNGTMYSALIYTSVINVSIEQAALPMAILIANFIFFRTRVTPLQMAGFFASVVGVAVTASHGDLTRLLALDVNLGDALMMLAVLLYSGYTVALRLKPQIHWQSLMIVMSGAAALSSLPFAAAEYALDAAVLPDLRGWAIAGFTAIFPSLLAQTFFMRGVELIGANRAGLFINMVPVMGTLLSILLLGEAFHAYHAVAMALVLGGIGIAEWSGRRNASL